MKKLSLTYEIDNIIIPVIDPSTMTNTSPDKFSKKTGGYATKVTQLPDEEQPEQVKLSDASDVDESYKWGYYQGVLQAADMNDDTSWCFNCSKTGHRWKQCTKPLWEGLKHTTGRLQELQLNFKGDVKRMEVHIPWLGAMAPATVAAQA